MTGMLRVLWHQDSFDDNLAWRYSSTASKMIRFQLIAPNFDGTLAATFSDSKCRKMTEESVCQHLAAVKIHDVKRNLGFDDVSHPTIQGSENGSAANMLLCSGLPKSLFQEDCSGEWLILAACVLFR
jgi:hypothetical protein